MDREPIQENAVPENVPALTEQEKPMQETVPAQIAPEVPAQEETPAPAQPEAVPAPKKPEKEPFSLRPARFFAGFSGTLAALLLLLRIVLSFRDDWGEAFYRGVTMHTQGFLARLTSPLPFSLAETLVILLPLVLLFVLVAYIVRLAKHQKHRAARLLFVLLSVAFLLFCNYIVNLSALYCRPSLSKMTGIPNEPVSAADLSRAAEAVCDKLADLTRSEDFHFYRGSAVCPYAFPALSDRIDEAYAAYAQKQAWMSPYGGARAKQIAFSEYVTYTHLSGMYTPYTGEANVNTNYPAYIVASSMAHEKAHQRGVAPENEANLVSFFVLAESGDDYLEYCAYATIYDDLLGALYVADPEAYLWLLQKTPDKVLGEYSAYAAFFRPYADSAASQVADRVNDGYLRLNGEKAGVQSYGLVVDMAVAYILSGNNA